jgi:hypothetical protein
VVERKEGWKNGEVGERWGKMRETGDKGKKGEKGERSRWREKRRRGVGEDYPCPLPHRFRDRVIFCKKSLGLWLYWQLRKGGDCTLLIFTGV